MVHVPRLGGGRGTLEYFLVRAETPEAAVERLKVARTDLLDAEIEARGEASQSLTDWLQPDHEVFSIAVVS